MPPLKKTKRDSVAGGAGLIRYFDVDEGGPKIDPKMVIGFTVAIIVLEILSKLILK